MQCAMHTRAHTQHTDLVYIHMFTGRDTHAHTHFIYICTHLHAHTRRAVIVVLDDHLTFATSVLAFFLINVLYFLAAYVLQKVTRTTLPQYCVYYVLISHFNFHYSGTLLNRHPSTADTHNIMDNITDNSESPNCPSIHF